MIYQKYGQVSTDIKVHSFDDVMNTNRTGVKSGCISTDVIHAKLFFWVSFITLTALPCNDIQIFNTLHFDTSCKFTILDNAVTWIQNTLKH